MLQRMYRQARSEFPTEQILIATSEAQADSVRYQIGSAVNVVLEPSSRDTFAAIALAVVHLKDQGAAKEDVVAVLPVDAYAEQQYMKTVRQMCVVAATEDIDMVLMGVSPLAPLSRYGYITVANQQPGYIKAAQFIEKPDEQTAEQLIKEGALCNGGSFVFRLGYLLGIISKRLGVNDEVALRLMYEQIEKTSFDYAVVEQASSIAVVPYEGQWEDLGTWGALAHHFPSGFGPSFQTESTNCVVMNELAIPIALVGVDNLIVAAGIDGIAITTAQACEQMKQIPDAVKQKSRFEQFPAGVRKILDRQEHSQTSLLQLQESGMVSFLYGKSYRVVLVCTSGEGELSIDGATQLFKSGQSISINGKKLVTLRTKTSMELSETVVQVASIFP